LLARFGGGFNFFKMMEIVLISVTALLGGALALYARERQKNKKLSVALSQISKETHRLNGKYHDVHNKAYGAHITVDQAYFSKGEYLVYPMAMLEKVHKDLQFRIVKLNADIMTASQAKLPEYSVRAINPNTRQYMVDPLRHEISK